MNPTQNSPSFFSLDRVEKLQTHAQLNYSSQISVDEISVASTAKHLTAVV